MLKLKLKDEFKPKDPPATKLAVSPLTGYPPPAEHQFKPGKEWRGNAGGRPKVLERSLAKHLRSKAPNGKLVAENIVEALCEKASSQGKESVAAYNAIKATVEPANAEDATSGSGNVDWGLIREFHRAYMVRMMKTIET